MNVSFAAVGMDDAFVIITTWNRINKANQDLTIEERIGLTMQHAGVSVTVTSFSDLVAFACGISTVRFVMWCLEKIYDATFVQSLNHQMHDNLSCMQEMDFIIYCAHK